MKRDGQRVAIRRRHVGWRTIQETIAENPPPGFVDDGEPRRNRTSRGGPDRVGGLIYRNGRGSRERERPKRNAASRIAVRVRMFVRESCVGRGGCPDIRGREKEGHVKRIGVEIKCPVQEIGSSGIWEGPGGSRHFNTPFSYLRDVPRYVGKFCKSDMCILYPCENRALCSLAYSHAHSCMPAS